MYFPLTQMQKRLKEIIVIPIFFHLLKKIYAVVIKVPSEETEKVVLKVNKAGIKRVWLQQGSQSEKAINFSQENGIDCVSNECILMLS
jgi:predicted CoA-binding protein